MATYKFTLNWLSKLFMHHDNLDGATEVQNWWRDPKNKGISVKGDDRSPAWTWKTYLYINPDTLKIAIPSANLQSCLAAAGTHFSSGRSSLKKTVAAGVLVKDEYLRFTVKGKEISSEPIITTKEGCSNDFDAHKSLAARLGFALHAKRAKIPGGKKNVRVRPVFENWQVTGQVETMLNDITTPILRDLFTLAGQRIGLGDWRPGSPCSPGQYGRFTAIVEEI